MSDDLIIYLDEATTSTNTDQPKPKKKRRTPEEIEAEKKQKLIARNKRVIDSSTNTNAEKYVYCHIGRELLNYIYGLESGLKLLLDDRKLSFEKQLVVDNDLGMWVKFYRELLDVDDEGNIHNCMLMLPKNLLIIPSDEFQRLLGSNFVEAITRRVEWDPLANSDLCLICYGKRQFSQSVLLEHELDIHEKLKAQIFCIPDLDELSLFIAQMFRGYANKIKSEHRFREGYASVPVIKGIAHGKKEEIISDWWDKMLQIVPRMIDAKRRAIIRHIPDPFAAIRSLSTQSDEDFIQELTDVVCENGMRVGPATARKVFIMLTDCTGEEIIE